MTSQIRGKHEAKNERMAQYLALTHSFIAQFTKFIVAQVPRSENKMVDALANLASSALYPYHVELNVLTHSSISEEAALVAKTRTNDSWMIPIAAYLNNGICSRT